MLLYCQNVLKICCHHVLFFFFTVSECAGADRAQCAASWEKATHRNKWPSWKIHDRIWTLPPNSWWPLTAVQLTAFLHLFFKYFFPRLRFIKYALHISDEVMKRFSWFAEKTSVFISSPRRRYSISSSSIIKLKKRFSSFNCSNRLFYAFCKFSLLELS